jgi:AraC family transcriptional regulator
MSISMQTVAHSSSKAHGVESGHLAAQLTQLIGTIGHDLDDARAEAFINLASALISPALRPASDDVMPQFVAGGLAPWQFRRIAAHVAAHIDQPLNVSTLAVLAKRSGAQFCRSFKVSFGQTPSAYVLQKRIDHAKRLMFQTRLPLAQIALACGFADQAHFSTRFRGLTGESPNRWRRTNSLDA